MEKEKLRPGWLVIAIVGVSLAALAPLIPSYFPRYFPVSHLGEVELGMSEVDVTLAFGRKADGAAVSKDGRTKVLHFATGPYYREAYLRKIAGAFQVYQTCTNIRHVESAGLNINDRYNENDVIRTLGQPSYVSVNAEGTRKISSFKATKLAFMFDTGMIVEICLSDSLPVRFGKEYGR